jgi:hypothetical protein
MLQCSVGPQSEIWTPNLTSVVRVAALRACSAACVLGGCRVVDPAPWQSCSASDSQGTRLHLVLKPNPVQQSVWFTDMGQAHAQRVDVGLKRGLMPWPFCCSEQALADAALGDVPQGVLGP